MDNDQIFIDYSRNAHRAKKGMKRSQARKGSGATADLTSMIIKRIRKQGGYAVRINVSGIWDEAEQRWRKSPTDRGTADIHACIFGRHVSIEVKTGADAQSEEQKLCQQQVTEAGGTYLIVHQYADYYAWERYNV